jgi:PmbA protein
MPLCTADEAFEIARAIVLRSPADETEVTVDSLEDRFVRFAGEGPTQDGDRERVEIAIRARFGPRGGPRAGGVPSAPGEWREARTTCGSLSRTSLERALEQCVELARASPSNPELVELGGPVDVPQTSPERPTLDHTFQEKAEWIGQALEAARAAGLSASGLAQTTALSRAIVNSRGREVHGATSRASFACTASGRGGAGFAHAIASNVDALDPRGVIARAVDKASRSQSPRSLEPGEYTVVLEPPAVSAILLFAAYQGFGAREVEEGSSFLCGRIGERALSESVTIWDDAANELLAGLAFDGEGTPKRRVPLVERGVLGQPVTDRTWANKRGTQSTGHAQPQPSSQGPMPANLVVARGDSSLEELIEGVERGLLVSQLHYVNAIDPKELLLTGMTRNGTFLIEGGRVQTAVKNLRFTDGLVRALSAVTGVGDTWQVAGALFEGEVVAPPLRIDGFRFTSTTDF